ncbi:hypothetical protein [Paludisphaera soli]|uniref:hypothetical protein n=1 Tax=Paludisphaera soli TaxID=2712865 RepID=UPI0013EA15FD|nr:hypothetical protein [Paludisphaera soli]
MKTRREPRCGFFRGLVLGLAAAAVGSPLGAAQSTDGPAADFEAALARLGPNPTALRSTVDPSPKPTIVIGLDRYREEAETLARRHGLAFLSHLTGLIESRPGEPGGLARRELAFATLMAMSGEEEVSRILERCLTRREGHDDLALVAATYASPSLGRRLGLAAMAKARPAGSSLEDAAALLRFFGENEDLKQLELLVAAERPDRTPATRKLDSNLAAMRRRLELPAAMRADWADDDLAVWRGANYTRDRSASGTQGLAINSLGLTARGRLRPAYLKDRLRASSITSEELFLVTLAVKHQGEASLTPELAEIVSDERLGWQNAAEALMSIGDPAGLESLRAFLLQSTGGPSASEAEAALRARRKRLLKYLTGQSVFAAMTPATLGFWTRLSEDQSFSPAERAAFAAARDAVKDTLKTNPKGFRL